MPDILDEARGPTKGIGDPVARKEIEKLWSVWEGRSPSQQNHSLVTRADLLAVETSVTQRINALTPASPLQTTIVGGGTVTGGASSANLLVSNNTWTGSNLWQQQASLTVKPSRFVSLEAGALVPALVATILVPTDFSAAVDIQRTSNVATAAGIGGSTALYVQHRAQGDVGPAVLTSGVRVAMESRQVGGATVATYLSVANLGHDSNGSGLHIDAYHNPTGVGGVTYGVNVEMFGNQFSQIGKTVGYLMRAYGSAPPYLRHADYGFLATAESPFTQARILFPFSAGSALLGRLNCEVAFDASFANCAVAALSMSTGNRILFDGNSSGFGLHSNGGVALQVTRNGNPLISALAGGGLQLNVGTLVVTFPNTRPPRGGDHFAEWAVVLGGQTRWIPFYA